MNLTYFEGRLARLFQHKVIVNCERDPYLIRWYVLRTRFLAIFIHKFVRSDEDRALHDHPWNFLVIPIWRGYIEHSQHTSPMVGDTWEVTRRVWPILGTRFRRAEYRHRVELIQGKPSWSIFIRFTERRTWGFWPKDGFIAWNKWWADKCE
jgi:hypothetical protein